MALVEIRNVTFSFGSTQVLSKITFSVHKGDFVGLIGPNGSGKTTLVKLLLGLYKPQTGKILINGVESKSFTDWGIIGYVPQKGDFSQEFPATVREVVQTGLLSRKKFPKRYNAQDSQTVNDTLIHVGMQGLLNRRFSQLSGGQQQRVLIARALVTSPQLLILDEPTAGVDQKTQQQFYDLLGELHKNHITIILVSHDLARITSHVTKVASLNTTLSFYGTHEEFCMQPDHNEDHHCLTLHSDDESHCKRRTC